MPPNQDEAIFEDEFETRETALQLTPLIFAITPQSSESSFSLSTTPTTDESISSNLNYDPDIALLFASVRIPVEQNLRELLLKVTETEDLKNVTEVKLRVIARDVSLQHLSIHTPLLRELTLDGSVISSLRDIGCSLKHLKILRVNRCGLTCFDGLFGLETLEEIYAGNNKIEDVSPCSHLPGIKLIDVRNNNVTRFTCVSFLSLCDTLRHLVLIGNSLENKPNYRETIKRYLPRLLTLDGTTFDNKNESLECPSFSDDDSDMDDYNQNLNVCISEIKPISLEENHKTSSSSLPPIGNINANRPSTANNRRFDAVKKLTRPHTTSTLHKAKNDTQLPEISNEKKQPSSLTSGEPICGNIAVSLRNRLKITEAWPEH